MRVDRTEVAIMILVMTAAGLVLTAPLLGRLGVPGWADVTMAVAAGAGFGAFVLVAVHTFRAARGRGAGRKEGKT